MTGIAAEPSAAESGADDATKTTDATTGTSEQTGGTQGTSESSQTGVSANPEDTGNQGSVSADTDETKSPMDTLSDDMKAFLETKGIKSVDDFGKMAQSLKDANDLISRGEHKKADDGNTVTDADYKFEAPENADELGYNKDFDDWFADRAKHHKLDPATAKAIRNDFFDFAKGSLTSQGEADQTALTERLGEAEVALKKEWGQTDGPTFKHNLEMANRAIRELGFDTNALGVTADFNGVKSVSDANFYQKMAQVGATMFAEDSLYGAPATGAVNPFAKETHDVTAQGQLWKNDQETAVALIRSLPAADQVRYKGLLEKAGVAA